MLAGGTGWDTAHQAVLVPLCRGEGWASSILACLFWPTVFVSAPELATQTPRKELGTHIDAPGTCSVQFCGINYAHAAKQADQTSTSGLWIVPLFQQCWQQHVAHPLHNRGVVAHDCESSIAGKAAK